MLKNKMLHRIIRWGLGIHGTIHVAEFFTNIYESAWISAVLSLVAGLLMLGGAFIDYSHHRKDGHNCG